MKLYVQIYPNKIKNRILFKLKTGYKLELLSPETRKLLGSIKNDVDQDKDGKDVSFIEVWFTDQNSEPLDNVNLTLIIGLIL